MMNGKWMRLYNCVFFLFSKKYIKNFIVILRDDKMYKMAGLMKWLIILVKKMKFNGYQEVLKGLMTSVKVQFDSLV